MATIRTIKNEMHIADCSELDTLLIEAQDFIASYPELTEWFRNHVFREYNRRKFFYCGGTDMLEPYDGGYKPLGDLTSQVDEFLLLEDGSYLLLEDDSRILLQ